MSELVVLCAPDGRAIGTADKIMMLAAIHDRMVAEPRLTAPWFAGCFWNRAMLSPIVKTR